MSLLVWQTNIIKKIYFPRLIIPISSILVSLFDFLMASIIFAGTLLYYHNEVSVNVLLLLACVPASILLTCISTFGIGTLLAALNIKYRDFRYVIPFMVQALLFITPVIYPVSMLGNVWLKYIVAINPIYAGVTLFRSAFVPVPMDAQLMTISVCSAVVVFVIGLFYFRKTEYFFADLA